MSFVDMDNADNAISGKTGPRKCVYTLLRGNMYYKWMDMDYP